MLLPTTTLPLQKNRGTPENPPCKKSAELFLKKSRETGSGFRKYPAILALHYFFFFTGGSACPTCPIGSTKASKATSPTPQATSSITGSAVCVIFLYRLVSFFTSICCSPQGTSFPSGWPPSYVGPSEPASTPTTALSYYCT